MQGVSRLKPVFPYFGKKQRIASVIWGRLGNPAHYAEPFLGSAAVLLARPQPGPHEIVNDKDQYIANFWRAIQRDPEKTAHWADCPINHCEMEARHKWLCWHVRKREHQERMRDDPDYYDARIAGYWVYVQSLWIGAGVCAGVWYGRGDSRSKGRGVHGGDVHKIPHIANRQGITALETGARGSNVHLTRPRIANRQGITSLSSVSSVFAALSERLRRVMVLCGDWSTCLKPFQWGRLTSAAVFLDPPYAMNIAAAGGKHNKTGERRTSIYT